MKQTEGVKVKWPWKSRVKVIRKIYAWHASQSRGAMGTIQMCLIQGQVEIKFDNGWTLQMDEAGVDKYLKIVPDNG
jgi:hypothetical protein